MDGFINNIWTGRAGLAKTYWGYGFLGGLIWGVVLSLLPQGAPISIVAVVFFVAFLVLVNVGIWRAAALYLGNPLWAALAKIAVASFPVFILIGVVATVAVTGGRPTLEAPRSRTPAPPAAAASPANPFSDPNYGAQATDEREALVSAERTHLQRIYAAHPDADAVARSAAFQKWLAATPLFRDTLRTGSTQEVIDMFSAFKHSQRSP